MKRIITVLVVAVLLAVIVPAGLGCPKTPSEFEASGTMKQIAYIMDPNPEMENGKITFEGSTYFFDVHGTLEGVIVVDGIMVIDTTTGILTMDAIGTFTGEVDGKSGSYFYSAAGTGHFTSPTGDAGEITGEHTIISGTGELVNLRGSLHVENTFDKTTGMTETYSGTLRFEE
jgi:hypothetical protein